MRFPPHTASQEAGAGGGGGSAERRRDSSRHCPRWPARREARPGATGLSLRPRPGPGLPSARSGTEPSPGPGVTWPPACVSDRPAEGPEEVLQHRQPRLRARGGGRAPQRRHGGCRGHGKALLPHALSPGCPGNLGVTGAVCVQDRLGEVGPGFWDPASSASCHPSDSLRG